MCCAKLKIEILGDGRCQKKKTIIKIYIYIIFVFPLRVCL